MKHPLVLKKLVLETKQKKKKNRTRKLKSCATVRKTIPIFKSYLSEEKERYIGFRLKNAAFCYYC